MRPRTQKSVSARDKTTGSRRALPAIALATPKFYRKPAFAKAVRAALIRAFPALHVTASPDDYPSSVALVVLLDGWGTLRFGGAIQLCQELSAKTLVITTDKRRDLAGPLDAGANDAARWPIPKGELIARVRVQLRQASSAVPKIKFHLDSTQQALVGATGSVPLTRSQFSILYVLLRQPGSWISSQKLIDSAMISEPTGTGSLRAQIHRLRNLLQHDAWRIQSNRVHGYRFDLSAAR